MNNCNYTATWNAATVPVGCYNNITERFLVVALGLATKELGKLVHCSALLSIHRWEAMAAELLLGLPCCLHQLGKSLMQ